MKISNLINPTVLYKQFLAIAFWFVLGGGLVLWYHECPPTTSINLEENNKVKKGGQINSGLSGLVGNSMNADQSVDCDEYIRGLSMKEIKAKRKNY
ncbi:MAG: hypothetical protein JXR07_20495 [Reichenbachiella sp.]